MTSAWYWQLGSPANQDRFFPTFNRKWPYKAHTSLTQLCNSWTGLEEVSTVWILQNLLAQLTRSKNISPIIGERRVDVLGHPSSFLFLVLCKATVEAKSTSNKDAWGHSLPKKLWGNKAAQNHGNPGPRWREAVASAYFFSEFEAECTQMSIMQNLKNYATMFSFNIFMAFTYIEFI